MKEKIAFTGKTEVIQEDWSQSPCSRCPETPCCRNLPLAEMRLDNQDDFINLLLTSCYTDLYPALKSSGEWIIYLRRDCRFLEPPGGKCSIHGAPDQSLICKTYDPHNCWYTRAFRRDASRVLIPFDTRSLIALEKDNHLIHNRFREDLPEEGLHRYAADPLLSRSAQPEPPRETLPLRLPYRTAGSDRFLFFPPFTRPQTRNQFSLLTFRLGFPGVFLAAADNLWAFGVETSLDPRVLEQIRADYYPSLAHKDYRFSFPQVKRNQEPFSETGEQWIVLGKKELPLLESLTRFDEFGNVTRHPTSAEILTALTTRNPDRAA